jgi:hypothetical protein
MSKAVMEQALDALYTLYMDDDGLKGFEWPKCRDAIVALRAELAKPEPEPVGFLWRWKAKEHEPADANPWQFRDVPVHQSNIDMLDLIPLYRREDV